MRDEVSRLLLILSILAVLILAVIYLLYKPGPKPDAVFPMANQHIEWHYAGK